MVKLKSFLWTILILFLVTASNVYSATVFTDEFEEGSIDFSHWVVWGRNLSWTPSDAGSWTWSHDETIWDPGDPDGYLRLRVEGPGSGNSYGAIAWVRTAYNFNDGGDYTLNFTWKADVSDSDSHINLYCIQVTDGYMLSFQEYHGWWNFTPDQGMEGTTDLLLGTSQWGWGIPHAYLCQSDSPKQTWSITISPAAVACLYDGPDGTGLLLHEGSLDPEKPWYLRFMVADATSSGYPAGDTRLNLYRYEAIPEPATLLLLGLGGLGLRRIYRRGR